MCVDGAELIAHRQVSYWESQYTLLSHTLAVTDPEHSAYVHDALGAALLNPATSMTRHDLETFDTEQKRMDEARRHYEQALGLRRQLPRGGPGTIRHGSGTTPTRAAGWNSEQER